MLFGNDKKECQYWEEDEDLDYDPDYINSARTFEMPAPCGCCEACQNLFIKFYEN